MVQKKKNIACLESLWDDDTENRLNVIPLLEVISRSWKIKFSHLTCNTVEELVYNLHLLRKRNYGILYLAFHGSPGKIHLHNGDELSLRDLSEMMGDKFTDWIVHFSSCNTLKKQSDAYDFINSTQVSIATGFTRSVNWIESAAFELMLFQNLQYYKSPKVACKTLLEKHQSLAEITGFISFSKITPK